MKNFIVLFAFLLCTGTVFSKTNPPTTNPVQQSGDVKITTRPIEPLSIVDYDGVNGLPDNEINGHLGNIIKGQNWTGINIPVNMFKFTREGGTGTPGTGFMDDNGEPYEALMTFSMPNPVNGVTVTGYWHWYDTPPNWNSGFPNNPINQTFRWYGPQYTGYAVLHITSVSAASNATLGQALFVATCTGYYSTL
mgnify:FL=1